MNPGRALFVGGAGVGHFGSVRLLVAGGHLVNEDCSQRRKVLIDSTLRIPSILLTQNAGANSGGNGKLALMPESHGFNRWLCAPSSDHFECSLDLVPFPLFGLPRTAGCQVRHIGSTPATTQATGL